MTRTDAIALARKLKNLADHRNTPPGEATAARERLATIMAKFELRPEDLDEARVEPGHATTEVPPEDILRGVYDSKTGRFDFDVLDAVIDTLPDPKAKNIMRGVSGVMRLAEIFFKRR